MLPCNLTTIFLAACRAKLNAVLVMRMPLEIRDAKMSFLMPPKKFYHFGYFVKKKVEKGISSKINNFKKI